MISHPPMEMSLKGSGSWFGSSWDTIWSKGKEGCGKETLQTGDLGGGIARVLQTGSVSLPREAKCGDSPFHSRPPHAQRGNAAKAAWGALCFVP